MKTQSCLFVAAMACFIATGCVGSPEKSLPSSNKEFKVDILFTDADGFTVKRFVDGGREHYYVTPAGRAEHEYTVGGHKSKHIVRDAIPTAEKN